MIKIVKRVTLHLLQILCKLIWEAVEKKSLIPKTQIGFDRLDKTAGWR